VLSTPANFETRAHWLGYLGILPLALGTALALTGIQADTAIYATHSYAAIILTFIGAIHWGRALQVNDLTLLNLSIAPSVLAWFSLLIPALYGIPLLIACYLVVLAFDYREYTDMNWFRRLRTQLTLGVCALLVVSWITI
jgi:hypothetical protein